MVCGLEDGGKTDYFTGSVFNDTTSTVAMWAAIICAVLGKFFGFMKVRHRNLRQHLFMSTINCIGKNLKKRRKSRHELFWKKS